MAASTINGAVYGTGLDTMYSERPIKHTVSLAANGVATESLVARNPDVKVFVLGNLTNAEAATLGGWLRRGDPVEIVSDAYGTTSGVVDRFEGKMLGATGGSGRLYVQTGTSDIAASYVVATLANDFSLTQSSAPWLMGATHTLVSGPSATAATSWSLTAISPDGTTGTVTVQRWTGNDGTYGIAAVV
jgi:hypothetical protein